MLYTKTYRTRWPPGVHVGTRGGYVSATGALSPVLVLSVLLRISVLLRPQAWGKKGICAKPVGPATYPHTCPRRLRGPFRSPQRRGSPTGPFWVRVAHTAGPPTNKAPTSLKALRALLPILLTPPFVSRRPPPVPRLDSTLHFRCVPRAVCEEEG